MPQFSLITQSLQKILPPGKYFAPHWLNNYCSPSPSNPSASRHINNRQSVYVFLNSEPQLRKSKQLNNHKMKARIKRVFNSCYFWSPKKKRVCLKFPSITNTSVQQVLQSRFKINVTLFYCRIFFTIYRINKMVNEHIVDYHPHLSEVTLIIHPFRFFQSPQGFI